MSLNFINEPYWVKIKIAGDETQTFQVSGVRFQVSGSWSLVTGFWSLVILVTLVAGYWLEAESKAHSA
jgi:hypothetical protein